MSFLIPQKITHIMYEKSASILDLLRSATYAIPTVLRL